jgi:pilus assembly protein Flp/PilA
MKTQWHKLCMQMQEFLSCEDGQDLVEYALVVALIALGATAGMQTIASDINSAFGSIGSSLTTIV